MIVETKNLTSAILDLAVARAWYGYDYKLPLPFFSPSVDWDQGGPIIEREDIAMWPDQEGGWFASTDQGKSMDYHGETALIAAMRCYVGSKLGDTVDISEELL